MNLPKPAKKLPKSANFKNNRPWGILGGVSGAISKWNLTMLFAIPGILVLLLTIWMAFHPDLKGFSESLTAAQAEG